MNHIGLILGENNPEKTSEKTPHKKKNIPKKKQPEANRPVLGIFLVNILIGVFLLRAPPPSLFGSWVLAAPHVRAPTPGLQHFGLFKPGGSRFLI